MAVLIKAKDVPNSNATATSIPANSIIECGIKEELVTEELSQMAKEFI
jgi:hypothetical protein